MASSSLGSKDIKVRNMCFSTDHSTIQRYSTTSIYIEAKPIYPGEPATSAHITWERVISEEEQEPEVNLSKNSHRIHWIYFI